MPRIVLLCLLSLGAFVACEAVRVRAGGVRLGPNPSVSIRLCKPFLDKVFAGACSLAGKYAHKCPFPDIEATVSGVDIAAKDVRIKNFTAPRINYTLVGPNLVQGTFVAPLVFLEGPFNATRRTFIKTQRDSGIVAFTAKDLAVAFSFSLAAFENGAPKIDKFSCKSTMGPASLNVRNCKENYAIEVMGLAAKGVRPLYTTQVCPIIQELIYGQINRLLAKFPNVLEVSPDLAFKFQIRPQVSTNHVQLDLFAKTLTDQVSPYQPAKFEDEPCGNAIGSVLISPALFNDIAYQLHEHKLLGFTINKNSPALLYTLVSLDPANEVCLGHVAPKLADKYGRDADVEIVFKSLKAPEVEFLPGKATFTAAVAAELNITKANGESFHEATIAIDLTGNLKVKIVDNVLYAKIEIEKVNAHLDEDHSEQWGDKIENIIKQVVEESINGGILLKGLKLILPFGLYFDSPLIRFASNTLQIQTGLKHYVRPQTSSEEIASRG